MNVFFTSTASVCKQIKYYLSLKFVQHKKKPIHWRKSATKSHSIFVAERTEVSFVLIIEKAENFVRKFLKNTTFSSKYSIINCCNVSTPETLSQEKQL